MCGTTNTALTTINSRTDHLVCCEITTSISTAWRPQQIQHRHLCTIRVSEHISAICTLEHMSVQQAMLIDPGDAIHLNIGGQRFTTSCAVLRRGAPEFYDSIVDSREATSDDRGWCEIQIDRDPRQFHAVLNFLRSGRCVLPDTVQGLLGLRAEAEAYQVSCSYVNRALAAS